MNARSTAKTSLALIVCLSLVAGCASSSKSSAADESADKSPEMVDDCRTFQPAESDGDGESDDKKPADELPFYAEGPIATVDGEPISAETFNDSVRKNTKRFPRQLPPRLRVRFQKQLAEQLIRKRLLDSALSEGFEVERRVIDREYEKVRQKFSSEEKFQAFLEKSGETTGSLKFQICQDQMYKKLIRRESPIEVTDEEVRAYYDDNTDRFDEPEKVKASHILVKVGKSAGDEEVAQARKRAEAIAQKAKAEGADFAKLAREESDGPTAKRGGDLGYFAKRKMVPKFSDKAFSMEPGTVSDPVRTRFGFHVIKVFDKKPGRTAPFEEVSEEIRTMLEREQMREASSKFMKKLAAEADVQRNFDNIVTPGENRPAPR